MSWFVAKNLWGVRVTTLESVSRAVADPSSLGGGAMWSSTAERPPRIDAEPSCPAERQTSARRSDRPSTMRSARPSTMPSARPEPLMRRQTEPATEGLVHDRKPEPGGASAS